MSLSEKYDLLLEVIGISPCSVAFSGGVDSSLVLKAAVDVFGISTVAFFADSVFQPPGELENARQIADLIGCDLRVVAAQPLSWSEIIDNPSDRCYYCKTRIYSIFINSLPEPKLVLADGSNLDDLDEYRPGRRAIAELGVQTPLIKAGFRKDDIRAIAKHLSLPNWNKKSASCLATRLPVGTNITIERLDLVAKCEKALHDLGFYDCRVRLLNHHENEVKVEVQKKDVEKILRNKVRENILKSLFHYGIEKVSLDLSGRNG